MKLFLLLLGEDVFTSAVDMIRSSNVHGPPAPIPDTVALHDVVGLQEGRALFLQLHEIKYHSCTNVWVTIYCTRG